MSDENGIVRFEKWSSLVKTSSAVTTKIAVTPVSGKFFIDRHPQYNPSVNANAGAKLTSSSYQDYTGTDLRYTCNASSSYISIHSKVYLWLKNFDVSDLSFESDATVGNIMSLDKIPDRFPDTIDGDVYLYFLGWTTGTWYSLIPNFTQANRIFKYTPSTGAFVPTNIIAG